MEVGGKEGKEKEGESMQDGAFFIGMQENGIEVKYQQDRVSFFPFQFIEGNGVAPEFQGLYQFLSQDFF